MKKKILYIGFNDINEINFGGAQCSERNYRVLNEIELVDKYIVERKSTCSSLLSILIFLFPPISFSDIREVKKRIKKEEYSCIFLDSSLAGFFSKMIKSKYNLKIITFFHNIEYDYINVRFGKSKKKYPYKLLAYYHERMAIHYSDKLITLSTRDSQRLEKLYNAKSSIIIPITFDDKIKEFDFNKNYLNSLEEKFYIFVGAFSIPNYEGIKWFVENVADKINCKLKIIGKGFEQKKEELSRENVEVIGYVENLTEYYLNSSFVISPLLDGAGMKVKIAEALMYGKTIFATKESFEGYDITEGKEGYICENVEDFICKINDNLANIERSNKFSRELFLNKYSNDFAIEQFKKIIM